MEGISDMKSTYELGMDNKNFLHEDIEAHIGEYETGAYCKSTDLGSRNYPSQMNFSQWII